MTNSLRTVTTYTITDSIYTYTLNSKFCNNLVQLVIFYKCIDNQALIKTRGIIGLCRLQQVLQ